MNGQRRGAAFASVKAIFLCILLVVVLTPSPSRAQNLFEAIFGLLSGQGMQSYRGIDPRLNPQVGPSSPSRESTSWRGGGHVAFCVRLCDGRFFPLPRNAGAPASSPAQLCGALCPAAKTRIYSGSAIEWAVALDGTRYSRLQNAFRFRKELVPDCSCNGGTGMATIQIDADPTLRRGDIVVTPAGPMVFSGARGPARQTRDFVPVEDYRGLPARLREEMVAMRIAENRGVEPVVVAAPSESGASFTHARPPDETVISLRGPD